MATAVVWMRVLGMAALLLLHRSSAPSMVAGDTYTAYNNTNDTIILTVQSLYSSQEGSEPCTGRVLAMRGSALVLGRCYTDSAAALGSFRYEPTSTGKYM